MKSKKCFKCQEEKPLDEFYAHPKMNDGHLGKCKECTKRDSIINRAINLEKILEYDRQRYRENQKRKETCRTVSLLQKTRHPDHKKAHSSFSNAIRDERIKRMPCEVCQSPNAEGHHPDYSKPMEVVWLCTKHHRELHRKFPEYYARLE